MEEKNYTITVTESQLRLLAEVTEKASRTIVGQLRYGVREELIRAMMRHETYSEDNMFLVDNLLRTIKALCWKQEEFTDYGVGYDKKSDTLWDMYEVMRHQLWKDSEEPLEYVVSAYPAHHWNKEEPLIKVEK